MKRVRGLAAAACAALLVLTAGGSVALAASAPAEWDGLVRAPSKRADAVWLLPGASFHGYAKVMLDPTEAAFRKNWQRDYNSASRATRMTDADVEAALATVRTSFGQILAKAFASGGYPVVTTPGPDVLRLRTAVINLQVNAPDKMTGGRSRSYAREAGGATLIVEVRDSVSGALLGRAVDSRVSGDMGAYRRNSVTNRSDFERLFEAWAKASVDGLNQLKATPPPA